MLNANPNASFQTFVCGVSHLNQIVFLFLNTGILFSPILDLFIFENLKFKMLS